MWCLPVALALALALGCGGRRVGLQDAALAEDGGVARTDAWGPCLNPSGDQDSDGISNGLEDCATNRDTDGDKIPDWRDVDSDGDGLLDRWEDINGDGQIGCCLVRCYQYGSAWQQANCQLNADGCGAGQRCISGDCFPPASCQCREGETSPYRRDTFGHGTPDYWWPCSYICQPPHMSFGPVQTRTSDATRGDWLVALELRARYSELKIKNPGMKMHAATIDHDDPGESVAGFVLSRDTSKENVQEELAAIVGALLSTPPGGSGARVTLRASGTADHSHDLYPMVRGATLDIQLASGASIARVRDQVLASMLGKPLSTLSNLPQPHGPAITDLVLRFTTLKRVEHSKDSNGKVLRDSSGNYLETGDHSKWRLLVIGALADRHDHQNPKRRTGFIVGDLAGGTALATAADRVGKECDVGTIQRLPVADIIWVVDESSSTKGNRQDIVNNANNFFSRALSSGLDFRMGVTNVCDPDGTSGAAVGKFCSSISTDSKDLGGTDRFLRPGEQATFSSCIKNPPGHPGGSSFGLVNAREAVNKHLPRAAGDPSRIRPFATLVIIMVTDQIPQSIASAIGSSNSRTCALDATTQASVNSALAPYRSLLSGITDPEAAAILHVVGGVCENTCNAPVAHGYRDLSSKLNGQVSDICQKNLGPSLQAMIDSITARASPVELDYEPISAFLAVELDATPIQRSRVNGFDYHPDENALVFTNVKYKKGSEVIASYNRWEAQTTFR